MDSIKTGIALSVVFPVICSILAIIFVWQLFSSFRQMSKNKKYRKYLALPVLWVGDKASKVYHRNECELAEKIIPENRVVFRRAEELTGYHKCPYCNP